MQTPTRVYGFDDVAGRRPFRDAELEDVELPVAALNLLALLLFLGRHADRCAFVYVREAPDDREEEGDGGVR